MKTKELELLAPAGKWEVAEAVAKAGADAIYAGGKRFNMRGLRTEYNFTDHELQRLTEFLHAQDKFLYITVNNLYYEKEISALKEYLLFLSELKVDALILQDLSLIKLVEELEINVPLHASVQMGINNLEAVKFLEDENFSRVVLSKNISLAEIKQISEQTSVSIEYFVHGDLCISHTGQCFMSSFISGKSGNRGICIKPCRWQYELRGPAAVTEDRQYYLAHNDLCLYNNLYDLYNAGVASLKIEGRMREADYLSRIVGIYHQEIERLMEHSGEEFKADPEGYKKLYDLRVRDFSQGSLYDRPGHESIGYTGTREPFFPTSPQHLQLLNENEYVNTIISSPNSLQEVSVKVGNLKAYDALLNKPVNRVIIGTEMFRGGNDGWNWNTIEDALERERQENQELFLELPRVVSQSDFNWELSRIFNLKNIAKADGIIANDLGTFRKIKQAGFKVWAGPGLNISNRQAVIFMLEQGAEKIIPSLELSIEDLNSLLAESEKLEVVAQGPLAGMITDCCIMSSAQGEHRNNCSNWCQQPHFLVDELGNRYRIRTDYNCRNYIYYPHHRCLLPYLGELGAMGLHSIFIDGQFYEFDELLAIVDIYTMAVQNLKQGKRKELKGFQRMLEIFPQGLTSHPLIRK